MKVQGNLSKTWENQRKSLKTVISLNLMPMIHWKQNDLTKKMHLITYPETYTIENSIIPSSSKLLQLQYFLWFQTPGLELSRRESQNEINSSIVDYRMFVYRFCFPDEGSKNEWCWNAAYKATMTIAVEKTSSHQDNRSFTFLNWDDRKRLSLHAPAPACSVREEKTTEKGMLE